MAVKENGKTQGNEPHAKGVRPIRSWDDQTHHLRFAIKVGLHRYPVGLANTTRWRRDRLVDAQQERIASLEENDRRMALAAQEAMAYAIDAERFLGTFEQVDTKGRFPVGAVDDVARRLLAWLEERGYTVVPLRKETDDAS